MSALAVKHSELCRLPEDLPGKTQLTEDAKRRIAGLVVEFNADVARAETELPGELRKSAMYLVPEEDQKSLPPRAAAILQRYAAADALAIRYRNFTHRVFVFLLVFTLLAMGALEGFAHIVKEIFAEHWWLRLVVCGFPFFWLVVAALWYFAHHGQYQKKYHDYRALAEGLRVQLFWNLLGLEKKPEDRVEELYLRKQKGELEWIRRAITYWRDEDAKKLTGDVGAGVDFRPLVRRCWIDAQADFFSRKAVSENRWAWGCRAVGYVALGLSVVLSVLLTYGVVAPKSAPAEKTEPESLRQLEKKLEVQEPMLIFGIAMFLATAALIFAYGDKMACAEHARQYASTQILFREYQRKLNAGMAPAEEEKLYEDLGMVALQENGDWLLLHRDRPLEIIPP
jgi:hypothetical protein